MSPVCAEITLCLPWQSNIEGALGCVSVYLLCELFSFRLQPKNIEEKMFMITILDRNTARRSLALTTARLAQPSCKSQTKHEHTCLDVASSDKTNQRHRPSLG